MGDRGHMLPCPALWTQSPEPHPISRQSHTLWSQHCEAGLGLLCAQAFLHALHLVLSPHMLPGTCPYEGHSGQPRLT